MNGLQDFKLKHKVGESEAKPTLHFPIPYSLFPIPYSLFPIPYFLTKI